MNTKVLFPSWHLQSIVRRYEFYEVDENVSPEEKILCLPGFSNGLLFFFYGGAPRLAKNRELSGLVEVPSCTFIPPTRIPSYNVRIQSLKVTRIIFYPGVISRLYHIPFREFDNQIIDAGFAFDRELHLIHEGLAESYAPIDQVRMIESYLLRKLSMQKQEKNIFTPLGSLINPDNYQPSIKLVSKQLGLSTRHLNRLVSRQIGFSTSDFIRIYRFNQILKYFHTVSQISLTQAAHHFGYYDQSHFIRDFKRMTDQTPREYIKLIGREPFVMYKSEDDYEVGGIFIKS